MEISFGGLSYINESIDANYQRCVNCYVTPPGEGGRSRGVTLPLPGLNLIKSFDADMCRGIWRVFDFVYTVIDDKLYKMEVNYKSKTVVNTTLIGALNTSTGRVRLANSTLEIMIVDGTENGYVYELKNYGEVNPGPIGGTVGDTYTLTLQGIVIINALNVAVALSDADLVSNINLKTPLTGITATLDTGTVTLTAADDSIITVSESGTGFTTGTDGLTITGGQFATGSLSPFRNITDVDYLGATDVVFGQGYFIVSVPDSDQMRASGVNDALSWDGADFTFAQSKGDKLLGLAMNKGELWAIGTETIEIYENTANSPGFAFTFKQGSALDIGGKTIDSLAYLNNSMVFLDSRGYVVQSDTSNYLVNTSSTYQLKILSTPAMHAAFSEYITIVDAVGFQFNYQGHMFYQINFPTAGKTWLCDLLTGGWSERDYLSEVARTKTYHLASFCCSIEDMLMVGSEQNANLYCMQKSNKTDAGQPISRIKSIGPINQEYLLIEISEIILRAQTGNVPANGDGSDPRISVKYSNDGAHTWSNQLTKRFGSAGEFALFLNWTELGTGREWFFEFELTEPIDFSFISLYIRATGVEDA